ncbi:MAG TPA: FAD-dependent oxidoreductase [bacterium]|nr:FAD-dependent oxidoreductase [bacterium]
MTLTDGKKIVVIGAQTAGLGAAAAARKIDRRARVTVVEQSIYSSSSPCGLPYFIGGEVQDIKKLTFAEPKVIRDKMGIDLRLKQRAISIDTEGRSLVCADLDAGSEYELGYDKLVLATGASPKLPPVEGVRAEGVFTLRNIGDATRIKEYIQERSPSRAVIVGAGYIGLEMAEALARLGVRVVVVEMLQNILVSLDPDIAAIVQQHLEENGVEVLTGSPLEKITCGPGGRVNGVLAGGQSIDAGVVILSLGVSPNVELARAAGIDTGELGAVVVDEHQRTSAPDVLAAGDCCQARSIVTGGETYMPLATVAEKQGKVAGENAAGGDSRFAGILGTSISGAFGLVFASTGLTLQAAKKCGLQAAGQAFMGHSHATYYPNARPLKLKVVFCPETGKLLGAQAVGQEGVVARMDAFVAAIHGGLSVKDLMQLDLPYSPPFGSSWDAIHVVAMMAQRRMR